MGRNDAVDRAVRGEAEAVLLGAGEWLGFAGVCLSSGMAKKKQNGTFEPIFGQSARRTG